MSYERIGDSVGSGRAISFWSLWCIVCTAETMYVAVVMQCVVLC